jgi:TatD DNase family protein
MISADNLSLIIDTHVHLDEPAFDADRNAVLDSARAVGVDRFVNIGYNPERWESSRALREAHPDVEMVLGIHPQEASRFDREMERNLQHAVATLRPIAIGETGLDFSRSSPTPVEQERAFRSQLDLAAELELPVVIHQRNAADAIMIELDRWPHLASIVLHSFDGDHRLRDWAIERHCYVGIGGLACKSSSGPLREVLRKVPRGRLLLETDAPYLAPPGVKNRRNSPANLPLIADLLAPLWHMGPEDLCRITTRNAQALFGFAAPVAQVE